MEQKAKTQKIITKSKELTKNNTEHILSMNRRGRVGVGRARKSTTG